MDLLASHQAGWPNTVAVSGTAFTQEHAQMLKRLSDNIVLALDADQAGIKAAGRAARAALQGGLNVKVAQLPSGADPADLILKEGAEKWRAAIRDSKEIITFLLDVLQEHLKDAGKFRRAVETVVLPYLADVQSPIERDAYMKEIAKRLGVSDSAVADTFAKVPRVPTLQKPAVPAPKKESDKLDGLARAQQAYAMLLWQRSLPRHAFDIAKFEADLKDAIGEEAYAILENLPEKEREAMRFSAEDLYGKSKAPGAEAEAILKVLLKARLSTELQEASEALRRAEEDRNEPEIERLMEINRLLTVRIAEARDVR
jgi:DNA primase